MGRSRKKQKRKNARTSPSGWLFVALVAATMMIVGVLYMFRESFEPAFIPRVSGQPSLEVDRNELDFGDVRLGRYVKASFKLTNVGDQPLRLTQAPFVRAVAGC